MRSLFTHKFWVILLAVLALGALMELAIGMKSMSFHEAQPFGRNDREVNLGAPVNAVGNFISIPLSTQILFWVTLLFLIVLISLLLSPEGRKRLLRMILRMAFTYWAIYLFLKRYPDFLSNLLGGHPAAQNDPAAQGGNVLLPPVFTPPQPNSWVMYVFSLVFAVVLVFAIWRAYLVWQKLNVPARSSMRELASIARASLRDLSSGAESSDVILKCYYRMSEVVAEKKRLDRRPSMTPNEFAVRLERAGLPAEAVQRLTGLFESVRYGGRRTSPQMINEAVSCLTAILNYCGETV